MCVCGCSYSSGCKWWFFSASSEIPCQSLTCPNAEHQTGKQRIPSLNGVWYDATGVKPSNLLLSRYSQMLYLKGPGHLSYNKQDRYTLDNQEYILVVLMGSDKSSSIGPLDISAVSCLIWDSLFGIKLVLMALINNTDMLMQWKWESVICSIKMYVHLSWSFTKINIFSTENTGCPEKNVKWNVL